VQLFSQAVSARGESLFVRVVFGQRESFLEWFDRFIAR
jgi:hypothetical protein